MNAIPEKSEIDDRRLVELHLAGDATAFRSIVERHQGLVCALAYSACGNLARSEDVAQEVFVAAWKQLAQLREPAKLRAWLGGMTRHLVHNAQRRAKRTPTAGAAELSPDTPAGTADPHEHAVGADEAALMWGALGGLAVSYREPMILYYREGHSVAAVAEALGISEDTARQRLARGRGMLTERMATFVEEALGRSAPTPAFATAVVAALPGATAPIAVARAAGAAAKGGLAGKAFFSAVAALPSLINGLSAFRQFRSHLESSRPSDRRAVTGMHRWPLIGNAVLLGCFALIIAAPVAASWKLLALILPASALALSARAGFRRERAMAAAGMAPSAVLAFEYRTRGGWLGVPWIHVRAGNGWHGRRAVGWIAISDSIAVGGLFASGPVAVAPCSVGGLALGLGSLGAVAVGGWAVGGVAMAAHAARGGIAVAGAFAWGGRAVAAHANDAAALGFFRSHVFFSITTTMGSVAVAAAFLGWLLPLVLIGWHRRRMQP